MSKHFFQSSTLRTALLAAYRVYAGLKPGEGPKIFVNSIPKAGTHLLMAVLSEIPGLMLARRHVARKDVDPGGGFRPLDDYAFDPDMLRRGLSAVRRGQVATGHIAWDPRALEVLRSEGFRTIFVTRDPERILVSRAHYVSGLRRHTLHRQLTTVSEDMEARIEALRKAAPANSLGPGWNAHETIISAYQGWADQPDMEDYLTVRFEDLLVKPGEDEARRRDALHKILTLCGPSSDELAVAALDAASRGKKSVTYRSPSAR